MKYIKNFEINSDEFLWLVQYIEDNDIQSYLFTDKESAKNWCIHLINQDRRQLMGHNYNDKMVFIDFDEAMFWYQNNVNITIKINSVQLKPKFEGSPEMIRKKDNKKYNL